MNNKAMIYKPTVEYQHFNKKPKDKTEAESISLKDYLKEFLINFLIYFLGITIFVLSIGVSYHTYTLIKLKIKKLSLLQENQALKKEYQYLTSKEVVLKKAKILELYPPQEEDVIRLE